MARTGKRDGAEATGSKTRLGPYWLWYRADRDDWAICWLYKQSTRRKSLGIGGGSRDDPPEKAQAALAAHFLGNEPEPDQVEPPERVYIDDITRRWLTEHVSRLERRCIANGVHLDRGRTSASIITIV